VYVVPCQHSIWALLLLLLSMDLRLASGKLFSPFLLVMFLHYWKFHQEDRFCLSFRIDDQKKGHSVMTMTRNMTVWLSETVRQTRASDE
jgi:hypothetical protein